MHVIIYNQVLHYDVNSSFYKLRSSDFYFFYDEEGKTIIPEVFDHLIISPSCVLAAGVNSKNKGIDLLGPDGLCLVTFDGSNAFFSNDNKYLLVLNKNEIFRFPVEMNAIKSSLDKYKISKSTKSRNSLLLRVL